MNEQNFDPRQAIDLGALKDRHVKSVAEHERVLTDMEEDHVKRWRKSIRRTFRGIFSDADRERNLARYAKEHA